MKKLLSIIVLSLLFCNTSIAKIIDLSCIGFKSYDFNTKKVNYNFKDYMHLSIDTNKKIMTEMSDSGNFSPEWILKEITERYYYSEEYKDMNETDFRIGANLNRFTGEFFSASTGDEGRYFYHCSPTKQLF